MVMGEQEDPGTGNAHETDKHKGKTQGWDSETTAEKSQFTLFLQTPHLNTKSPMRRNKLNTQ